MKFLPPNTLAYHNAAPQTHLHNLSELPTAVLAEASQEYKQGCDHANPMQEAVTFYTLNHAAAIVRETFSPNEVLPDWAQSIMNAYTNACVTQGERLLHYILCITTREMRHLKSCSLPFWAKVEKEFGHKSVDILKHISSDGDENTAMNKFLVTPPDMTIGQYIKTLSFGFHNAGTAGWSGSYGGHPWGEVMDAVVSFLHGDTSMEMLVDTGYTLCHNGGPIFNKGIMYGHWDDHLLTILDAQRAGQMLDLMLATETLGVKKTPQAEIAASLIKANFPEKVKGYVDWKLVDELRPDKEKHSKPHKYNKLTGVQGALKQPKLPKPVAKAKPVTVLEPMPPVLTHVEGKPVTVTGQWQVFPHQTVTVYKRGEK